MSLGINTLLDIGRKGLFASQMGITVTGNNIANVNTEGYRRRELRLDEAYNLDHNPGQVGTGVEAKEVIRYFDEFLETGYLDKLTMQERFSNLFNGLQSVENLFNESSGGGISEAMTKFFSDWQDLTVNPADYSTREALLADTKNLVALMHQADEHINRLQLQADDFIGQEVGELQRIISQIASVNRQIQVHEVEGVNNANELRDQRDSLVRELASIIDIKTVDNGGGDFTVMTKVGQPLVDGGEYYDVQFETPQAFRSLSAESNFDGMVYFEGADDLEYHIEVVTAGDISNTPAAAQFKVSLDGGKTFLTNDDGSTRLFSARPQANMVEVEDLKIYFGTQSDPAATPTTNLAVTDRFDIVPKKGLYWYKDASSKENITPLLTLSGEDGDRRTTGGSLAGLFTFRDAYLGKYDDKLDTLASALTWEINQVHSEGAGLVRHTSVSGTYEVLDNAAVLGDNTSALHYRDKLASGNTMMYVYTSAGNLVTNSTLDFTATGYDNFNPNAHSLQDVADAVNATFGGPPPLVNASIVGNKLQINAASGYEIEFGSDTANLGAALGLNTFFQGTDAGSINLNDKITTDVQHVNTSHINGAGEANPGDNTTAVRAAALQTKDVTVETYWEGESSQSLLAYYNTIIANVGSDTSSSEMHYQYQKSLADDLDARQTEMSGVNLDEEMSTLVKFQHSYTAAAKLITTADQMLQTLMTIKP